MHFLGGHASRVAHLGRVTFSQCGRNRSLLMLAWRWFLLLFTLQVLRRFGQNRPSAHGWLRYGKVNWNVLSFLHEKCHEYRKCHNVLYRKRRCMKEYLKPEMLFVLHGVLSCCVNNRCGLSFGLPLQSWSLRCLSRMAVIVKTVFKGKFQLQKISVWAEGLCGKTILNLHVVLIKQRVSYSNVIVPF